MIIYVYPADEYGCGYYRMIWPAAALRAQGHDVRIILPTNRVGIGGEINSRTGQLVGVNVPPDADVIVLQRVTMRNMSQAVPLIRARGVAVVVDMDDDLTKIDPNNPAFAVMQKGGHGAQALHSWGNAHRACLDATLVTVSTPALLKVYAPHGRGVVLENRVPSAYLDIPHDASVATFGWPGSVHSHPADPHQVGPAVARLIREGFTYSGVGPATGLREAFGLPGEPHTTGVLDMDRYPLAVAAMGVGMAPLADTRFNEAKSWLKPLEMMACGVPWVASPRVEYQRLHRLCGTGLLAAQPKDWHRLIKRVLTDDTLRADMSAKGRQAAANWTVEGSAWRWLEAWSFAADLQKKGVGRSTVKIETRGQETVS